MGDPETGTFWGFFNEFFLTLVTQNVPNFRRGGSPGIAFYLQ